jgi:hypothetical protein
MEATCVALAFADNESKYLAVTRRKWIGASRKMQQRPKRIMMFSSKYGLSAPTP